MPSKRPLLLFSKVPPYNTSESLRTPRNDLTERLPSSISLTYKNNSYFIVYLLAKTYFKIVIFDGVTQTVVFIGERFALHCAHIFSGHSATADDGAEAGARLGTGTYGAQIGHGAAFYTVF